MRVVIVDDEAPARAKLRRWLEHHQDVEIVGECADGFSAARLIETAEPDAAFVDVQMPGINGLQLAAQFESGSAPLIVFVTAYDAHALQAFDLNAVDYVLKPYDEERFKRTLERVRVRLATANGRTDAVQVARAEPGANQRLLVPVGAELRLIEAHSIHFLQADDNTCSCIRRRTTTCCAGRCAICCTSWASSALSRSTDRRPSTSLKSTR